MTLAELKALCYDHLGRSAPADGAHDLGHVRRVVRNAEALAANESADLRVVVPAACLHDCVAVRKDSPDRARGSRLSAAAAGRFLGDCGWDPERLPAIRHAIEAHSYSAGIAPETLEARVVQDADRLDSLGAIGIARCLLVGGHLDRPLLAEEDPFCDERAPDDSRYTIDHFYAKLFKLPATMQTEAGREEAQRRAALMRTFLQDLRAELG